MKWLSIYILERLASIILDVQSLMLMFLFVCKKKYLLFCIPCFLHMSVIKDYRANAFYETIIFQSSNDILKLWDCSFFQEECNPFHNMLYVNPKCYLLLTRNTDQI